MIGKKIKLLLERSNATVGELAISAGVSQTAVYNWLKKDSLDSRYLSACADFFNVPVTFFFDDDMDSLNKQNPTSKKDRSEEINSVVENLQGIVESLEKDKEDLRRDKEFLKKMLENALELRASMSGNSGEPGKLEGSVSERLSQIPKEAPMPGRAGGSQSRKVAGARATSA